MESHSIAVDKAALDLVPATIAHSYVVLPLRLEGDTLVLAFAESVSDPKIEKIKHILHRPLKLVETDATLLKAAIESHYGPAPPPDDKTSIVFTSWR
jgi:hypothetical protein